MYGAQGSSPQMLTLFGPLVPLSLLPGTSSYSSRGRRELTRLEFNRDTSDAPGSISNGAAITLNKADRIASGESSHSKYQLGCRSF